MGSTFADPSELDNGTADQRWIDTKRCVLRYRGQCQLHGHGVPGDDVCWLSGSSPGSIAVYVRGYGERAHIGKRL
jgi:hypothetical protein